MAKRKVDKLANDTSVAGNVRSHNTRTKNRIDDILGKTSKPTKPKPSRSNWWD